MKCEICGHTLSIYNETGKCFHHAVTPGQHKSRMEMLEEKFQISLCCPGHVDRGFNRVVHEYNG